MRVCGGGSTKAGPSPPNTTIAHVIFESYLLAKVNCRGESRRGKGWGVAVCWVRVEHTPAYWPHGTSPLPALAGVPSGGGGGLICPLDPNANGPPSPEVYLRWDAG